MARYLGVTWTTNEANGYTDLIPVDWVSGKKRNLKGQVHSYVSNTGQPSPMKCDVVAGPEVTTLDYSPYGKFDANKQWDPYVLFVKISDKTKLPTVTHAKQLGDRGSRAGVGLIEWIDDLDYFLSLRSSAIGRKNRLSSAPKKPKIITTIGTAFQRNPDVVAEVLSRAKGVCEHCRKPAPFKRKRDGMPYLEIHHVVRLIDGGDDTVENAIAVCPNCHRKAHFG